VNAIIHCVHNSDLSVFNQGTPSTVFIGYLTSLTWFPEVDHKIH